MSRRAKRKRPVRYLAYLIRLWRDGDRGPWRATLQDPHTQERRNFATLAGLRDFLEEQTGETWADPGQLDDALPDE